MTLNILTPIELGAPKYTSQPTRILNCDTCGTFTLHTLTKSGDYYVCACGEMIEYRINNAPAMWAIR